MKTFPQKRIPTIGPTGVWVELPNTLEYSEVNMMHTPMQHWNQLAKETPPKTFEEWWRIYNTLHGCPPAHVAAEAAWKAAKGEK